MLLSNDSTEGRVIRKTLEKLNTENKDLTTLYHQLTLLENTMDGLGFCLSAEGDLLSQWRGYAEDGAGLSIGFSKEYLEQLKEAELKKMDYDEEAHIAAVRSAFEIFTESIDAEEDYSKFYSNLRSQQGQMYGFFRKLFDFKSSAFKEEREWRLLSIINTNTPVTWSFRQAGNKIIPYKEIKLKNAENAIKKVLIGPKHSTPKNVIEDFLNKSGFKNVKVDYSSASYR